MWWREKPAWEASIIPECGPRRENAWRVVVMAHMATQTLMTPGRAGHPRVQRADVRPLHFIPSKCSQPACMQNCDSAQLPNALVAPNTEPGTMPHHQVNLRYFHRLMIQQSSIFLGVAIVRGSMARHPRRHPMLAAMHRRCLQPESRYAWQDRACI